MFPSNQNDIEKKLLSDNEIDRLIEQKIEQKIQNEIAEAKKEKKSVIIKDFQEVQSDKIFDTNTTYRVFNRKTRKESFINGVQADSLIGLNQEIRKNLENKYADNFTVNEYFIRFNSRIE